MPYFRAVAQAPRASTPERIGVLVGQSGYAGFALLFRGPALSTRVPERSPGHQYLALDLAADPLRRVLPFRPLRTARNYRKIWMPEGSPLGGVFESSDAIDRATGCMRRLGDECGSSSA